MTSKYDIVKFQVRGKDIYAVQNRETGLVKYAAALRYIAEDFKRVANGRIPATPGNTWLSEPTIWGVPADQVER